MYYLQIIKEHIKITLVANINKYIAIFWNGISGDKNEKAKASLKNSELIQRFKEVDSLPEDEQSVLIKIISAYVRGYRAKQAYAM